MISGYLPVEESKMAKAYLEMFLHMVEYHFRQQQQQQQQMILVDFVNPEIRDTMLVIHSTRPMNCNGQSKN
jgi:prophage maintenance system killer protein